MTLYIPKSSRFHFFHVETSSRMDVVPDNGLVDSIERVEDVEEKKVDTSQILDNEEETDVWRDIADALNRRSSQILDAEISHK